MENKNELKFCHEESLLKLFYAHKLHVEDICEQPESPAQAVMSLCNDIISILLKISISKIIEIIKKDTTNFSIQKADIPQYSSFDDCVYQVPYLLANCGLNGLEYTKMGYMLRKEPRKEGADQKYGENHAKTASLMGLCVIYKCRIYPSYFGIAYNSLSPENKKKLIPKICLLSNLIQHLFVEGASEELLEKCLSILSATTRIRRRSNVRNMIKTVNDSLTNEL